MVRRIYLHIGIPKTGTTSLQRYLWSHRQGLARNGCLYPESCLWGDKSHHKLFFAISGYTGAGGQSSWEETANSLHNEIKASAAEEVLISSELLANYRRPEAYRRLWSLIDGTAEDAYVMVGLRNLHSLYLSNYFQRVRDPRVALSISMQTWIQQRKVLQELESSLEWGHEFSASVGTRVWSRYEVQSSRNPVPFLQYMKRRYALSKQSDVHENRSTSTACTAVFRHLNSLQSLSLEQRIRLRSTDNMRRLQKLIQHCPELSKWDNSQTVGIGMKASQMITSQLKNSRLYTALDFLISKADLLELQTPVVEIDIDDLADSNDAEIKRVADELLVSLS